MDRLSTQFAFCIHLTIKSEISNLLLVYGANAKKHTASLRNNHWLKTLLSTSKNKENALVGVMIGETS